MIPLLPRRSGLLLTAIILAGSAFSRARTAPEGFYITLPVPYDRLTDVVRAVCADGVIHGTSQYEEETAITGAHPAGASATFPEWSGTGQVFYKVRPQTISPAHFVGSSDRGTVTVRYILEPVGADKTRISIDAVFVEDARGRRHVSSGLVETAEFREIAQRLKAIERQEKEHEAELRRQEQERQRQTRETEVRRLQEELAAQGARLASARAAVKELQSRVHALRLEALASVRVPAAEVKAFPFLEAETVRLASRDQVVRVIERSAYWTHVRLEDGQEGWIYTLLVGIPADENRGGDGQDTAATDPGGVRP